jgi:hypothetical protein
MRSLAFATAVLGLLASAAFTSASADCMQSDGGPAGFCDYGPYTGRFASPPNPQYSAQLLRSDHTRSFNHDGYDRHHESRPGFDR